MTRRFANLFDEFSPLCDAAHEWYVVLLLSDCNIFLKAKDYCYWKGGTYPCTHFLGNFGPRNFREKTTKAHTRTVSRKLSEISQKYVYCATSYQNIIEFKEMLIPCFTLNTNVHKKMTTRFLRYRTIFLKWPAQGLVFFFLLKG